MPDGLTIGQRVGLRLLQRPMLVDRGTGDRMRALSARLMRGDVVPEAEFAAVFPDRVAWDDDGPRDVAEVLIRRDGRLGIIAVSGALMFGADWIDMMFGATPTDWLVLALDKLAADQSVDSILLEVNSPGGSVAGTADVVAAVRRAKAAKPLYAIAHEHMFSAGYLYAALADELAITPSGALGSVGSIIATYDMSEYFAALGIKPFVVASDDHKAVGMPGLPLTQENTFDWRRTIEVAFDDFAKIVEEGRGMSHADIVGLRAAVFAAEDSVENGLADRVVEFGTYISELKARGARREEPRAARKARVMTKDELKTKHPELLASIEAEATQRANAAAQAAAPKPATIAELKAEFPGDDRASFRETCLEGSMTIHQARGAFAGVMAKERDQANARAAKLETDLAGVRNQLASLGEHGKGTDPVAGAPGGNRPEAGKPRTYSEAVDLVMAGQPEGKKDRHAAIRRANEMYPELRKAYASGVAGKPANAAS